MTYQFNSGKEFTIPNYCWYIEGGNHKILLDTGELSPVQSEKREKAIGGKIHTHLHNDHCENDYKCPNADIYVHEKEMERIHNPHPLDFRYLEDYIEDVEENGQIRILAGDTEILPDFKVIHTPAHTDGGMTVLIDTPSRKAAITGFCIISQNFNPYILTFGADRTLTQNRIGPGEVVDFTCKTPVWSGVFQG